MHTLKFILSEPTRCSGVYELRPVVGQGIIGFEGRVKTRAIIAKKDARQRV
jgi:hypothetical protein